MDIINRRSFLTLLGLGATATGIELVTPGPVRRYWQVPRSYAFGRNRLDATNALNIGTLRIYDGARPEDADDAIISQVQLAELSFGATAFGGNRLVHYDALVLNDKDRAALEDAIGLLESLGM